MVATRGLLISCVALLNIVYCATIKDIDTNKQPDEWVCELLPNGHDLSFGRGYKLTGRPYYIWKLQSPASFNSKESHSIDFFSVTGDRCNLQLNTSDDTLWRKFDNAVLPGFELRQYSAKMLYVVPNFFKSKGIIAVNMSTCNSMDISKMIIGKRDDHWNFMGNMIHYENGFDEIIQENNKRYRISYDFEGNRIGEPRPFLFNVTPAIIRPILPESRNSNFIVDYFDETNFFFKRVISLLDTDGQLIKHLRVFDDEDNFRNIDDISSSLYAYCSGYNDTECVQFDDLGKEKYRNTTKITGDLLGVSNLKEAGVVIFTATDKEVRAVVMQPGKISEKSYPVTKDRRDQIVVTDFDEDKDQFSVRIESGGKICRHTFSLQDEQR